MSSGIGFHNDYHIRRQNGKTIIHRNECPASIKARKTLDGAFSHENFGSKFDKPFGNRKYQFVPTSLTNPTSISQRYSERHKSTGNPPTEEIYERHSNQSSNATLALVTGLAVFLLGSLAYRNSDTLSYTGQNAWSSLQNLWQQATCRWTYSGYS